ncbi:hypothetical protein AA23498_3467 [Acetobacter nitrogenifigens DSM 23921 = NBRC 105050]|uniref:DUF6878 domain-containing protein n=1 Tax=Acetobacter nitrogenifigens DSM 23921 = NBRC 105050 TaxID=1120919 RepID=A0A511XFJ0_9PROT|nr:DUF6878 family protein [Acetobacter nitrogenifigens]GBQ99419.1 hypothetical protein AA23498_3467 [Acetobacter nitrogenifigens DSM 23921 = NBRC 105050]GEN61723.1 hypothetical protein ANI02nite_36070 [Acetobacter nitrogenifigens DSM 23921 = NBRC 105050]
MTSTFDNDNYATVAAYYKKQQQEAFARNREVIFVALQARGARKVFVTYDAGLDSSGIRDRKVEPEAVSLSGAVTVLVAGWDQAAPESRAQSLQNAIEEMAMQIVAFDHDGWEINEGAGGSVTFDVAERKIVLEHSENIIARRKYTHSY